MGSKQCNVEFGYQLSICSGTKENSVALVRERTISIERPPLVGEVSANLCGYRVLRGQRCGSLQP
jgi:hypothetical protein